MSHYILVILVSCSLTFKLCAAYVAFGGAHRLHSVYSVHSLCTGLSVKSVNFGSGLGIDSRLLYSVVYYTTDWTKSKY